MLSDRARKMSYSAILHALRYTFSVLLLWLRTAMLVLLAAHASAQSSMPQITAHVKGPDQVNLTWAAAADPGYGYLVEVQADADGRYTAWTELQPIPTAAGYICDSTVVHRGGRCIVSDPGGTHVYNPPTRGIPYWVTEATYIDPRDDSPAQFIAWGLKPNTEYHFRVRTYSGGASLTYGAYSNVSTVRTAAYSARYVSLTGNDANDGKAADRAHAWRTLAHASAALQCGEVLIIAGGTYANDVIRMPQNCSAAARAVLLVNEGETATLTSQPAGAAHAIELSGSYLVIDGLALASPGTAEGEYDVEIRGHHNALLNVDFHPPTVPSFKWGTVVYGAYNLIYRCYMHDYGSPDPAQNENGNGGFVLVVSDGGAVRNVIWSNHLTRGGHDESLCHRGCHENRWLNNVMDGGWGQGFLAGSGPGRNLFEGNVIKSVGQLVPYYKPAIQISAPENTVRRNVVINSRTWAIEMGSFSGDGASGNLIYNNTIYNPGGCYFQSSSRGYRAYYFDMLANNICYRMHDRVSRIYLGNVTNRVVNNSFLFTDGAGRALPEQPLVEWNQLGGPQFENPKTISAADRSYAPVFARNAPLSLPPAFIDEAHFDFHLSAASPLLDAGLPISDLLYGSTAGAVDPGAFGIRLAAGFHPPESRSEEASLKAIRSGNPPHQRALEAALLLALDQDDAATELIKTASASDTMERYERVRQGGEDAALWTSLAAEPERILEMADVYLQWGLLRDALELVAHRCPAGSSATVHPLVAYYRAYLRDRLDYPYYAAQDLRAASALPAKNISPRGPGTAIVLRSAIQRDPMDASARYLLATLHHNEGRDAEARDELKAVLKLRPGQPDASALLTKLGPDPSPARAPRAAPVSSGAPTSSAAPGNSPREIAAQALLAAASGDIDGAFRYFTATNFPKEKQEDAVREAYFELRVQRLVNAAVAHQCTGVDQGITHIGDDDASLPFTFGGFGGFMKSVRFQYLLALMEFSCVDENAARKRWEKLAKATPGMSSPDYAYAMLALNRISSDDGHGKARVALNFLRRQLDTAPPASKGAMLFNQGQLQLILGRKDEALASFRAGAEAGPPGMIEYLNRDSIRTIDIPR
jgi:hypothetical protein